MGLPMKHMSALRLISNILFEVLDLPILLVLIFSANRLHHNSIQIQSVKYHFIGMKT